MLAYIGKETESDHNPSDAENSHGTNVPEVGSNYINLDSDHSSINSSAVTPKQEVSDSCQLVRGPTQPFRSHQQNMLFRKAGTDLSGEPINVSHSKAPKTVDSFIGSNKTFSSYQEQFLRKSSKFR